MNKHLILLTAAIFSLIALSASLTCHAANRGVKFDPVFPARFPALSSPASVTKLSEAELKKQGYIKIGSIKVTIVTKTCRNTKKGEKCRVKRGNLNKKTTPRLLQEAAGQGGHTVALKTSNYASQERFSYRVCTEWSTLGGYRACISRGSVSGTNQIIYSQGDVWRKDDTGVMSEKKKIEYIKAGNFDRVKQLLDTGKIDLHKPDVELNYPLYYALKFSRYKITKLFLDKGAKLQNTSEYKSKYSSLYKIPALIVAVEGGNPSIVQLLIQRGAGVNKIHNKFYLPLLVAIVRHGRHVENILIKNAGSYLTFYPNQAKKNIPDLVQKADYFQIVQMLLKAGAKINQKIDGKPPIMEATDNGDVAMVQFLLKMGADPKIRAKRMSIRISAGNHRRYNNVLPIEWARHLINYHRKQNQGRAPGSSSYKTDQLKILNYQKIVLILEKAKAK